MKIFNRLAAKQKNYNTMHIQSPTHSEQIDLIERLRIENQELVRREKEAYAEAKEVLRLNPKFSVDKFALALQLKDQVEKKRFIGALRKAFSEQSNS